MEHVINLLQIPYAAEDSHPSNHHTASQIAIKAALSLTFWLKNYGTESI
jgi:hypothetical protein